MTLSEGSQIKVFGSSCSVGVDRRDLRSKHMWNLLHPKRVELQVKSFFKCHKILVESIRRQNTLVGIKAKCYHGWIIVILVWGMREIMFLLGENMTSLRVGVGLTLHSVKVTLFCSTCSGTVKRLGPSKEMRKVKWNNQATEVMGIFMCWNECN